MLLVEEGTGQCGVWWGAAKNSALYLSRAVGRGQGALVPIHHTNTKVHVQRVSVMGTKDCWNIITFKLVIMLYTIQSGHCECVV